MTRKRTTTKRLSPMSDSASRAIDIKARKRIEELYELTDEIINAYNEVNETYVNKIYRKYKQLQETNRKLRQQLSHHHCSGCTCIIPINEELQTEENPEENAEENGEEDAEEELAEVEEECSEGSIADEQDQNYKQRETSSSPVNQITTRSKKKNPFIISDIEDTQKFDVNDSRLNQKTSDNEGDDNTTDNGNGASMVVNENEDDNDNETTQDDEQSEQDDEEVDKNDDEDDEMARLPLNLQDIIQNKAKKNKGAKSYLLQIPRYPALCEFLREKSRTSFDQRPSESQVRPLIANHLSQTLANDAKIRMRLRDELREIHRSYLRTFMNDPHANTKLALKNKRLHLKKSPI